MHFLSEITFSSLSSCAHFRVANNFGSFPSEPSRGLKAFSLSKLTSEQELHRVFSSSEQKCNKKSLEADGKFQFVCTQRKGKSFDQSNINSKIHAVCFNYSLQSFALASSLTSTAHTTRKKFSSKFSETSIKTIFLALHTALRKMVKAFCLRFSYQQNLLAELFSGGLRRENGAREQGEHSPGRIKINLKFVRSEQRGGSSRRGVIKVSTR